LLKGSGMRLVKSKGEVMLDIKNPEPGAASNEGQAKADRGNNEAIL
jgi:hypothetical protein